MKIKFPLNILPSCTSVLNTILTKSTHLEFLNGTTSVTFSIQLTFQHILKHHNRRSKVYAQNIEDVSVLSWPWGADCPTSSSSYSLFKPFFPVIHETNPFPFYIFAPIFCFHLFYIVATMPSFLSFTLSFRLYPLNSLSH